MRINGNGQTVRNLRIEVPQSIFRALELHKARTGQSINKMAGGLLIPALQQMLTEAGALTVDGSAQSGDIVA